MVAAQPLKSRPPLTLRIKVGLGATVLSLAILVYPGQMALPLNVLTPLMPTMHGCANFGGPLVAVAFFGLAILLSLALICLGILAIVATALRWRFGLVTAVLINATVASLLMMTPLDYSASGDPGALSLYVLLTICAVIPLAATVLLLSPKVFGAWLKSGRSFTVTAVAAGLLLVPGAAGAVDLGSQVSGISAQPAAAVTTPIGPAC
jgi:hypothetical protein